MSCSQLRDRIARRIDESIYARASDLVEATSYLQIKLRDCFVCSRYVRIEIRLSYVFSKDFSPFWCVSVRGYLAATSGHVLTMDGDDGCEDWFGLFKRERIPRNESL